MSGSRFQGLAGVGWLVAASVLAACGGGNGKTIPEFCNKNTGSGGSEQTQAPRASSDETRDLGCYTPEGDAVTMRGSGGAKGTGGAGSMPEAGADAGDAG